MRDYPVRSERSAASASGRERAAPRAEKAAGSTKREGATPHRCRALAKGAVVRGEDEFVRIQKEPCVVDLVVPRRRKAVRDARRHVRALHAIPSGNLPLGPADEPRPAEHAQIAI
eukprot:6940982-Prymnesium_polylepis.1